MLEALTCKLLGHAEDTEIRYYWDIPLNPVSTADECMEDGFVACRSKHCSRCGHEFTTINIPTEDAPDPRETTPLL